MMPIMDAHHDAHHGLVLSLPVNRRERTTRPKATGARLRMTFFLSLKNRVKIYTIPQQFFFSIFIVILFCLKYLIF